MILPIFAYHRICASKDYVPSRWIVSEQAFRKQLGYLKSRNCYTPTSFDLLDPGGAGARQTGKPILLTFDDGYSDILDVALPILKEFGFSGIVSCLADFSRLTNWWDGKKNIPPARLLGPDEVKLLDSAGLEIASHTMSHPHLPLLDRNLMREELAKSKEVFEDLLGKEVRIFTYPYGETDRFVKAAVRETGYRCALAAFTGPISFDSDLFEIRRTEIRDQHNSIFLESTLLGIQYLRGWATRAVREQLHLLRLTRRPQAP